MENPPLVAKVIIDPRETAPKLGVRVFWNSQDSIAFMQDDPDSEPGMIVLHPDELELLLPHLPGLIAAARRAASEPPDDPKVDVLPE